MFRKSAVAAALLLITATSNTFALGLGKIDMQSALNQPMRASIDLTSAGGTDLSEVKVSIASAEAHQRAGLSRSRILGNFRFKVEEDSRGQAVIRVSSTDTIHEPFIEFMLELSWPKGRLMRQYTVLVDPPLTMPAAPAIPAAPLSSTPRATAIAAEPARRSRSSSAMTPTVRTAASAGTGQSASSYGPVRRSETLWTIAKQVRPDSSISVEQMMLALQRANPNAFMNNNINNLKAGSNLTIPSREEIVSISAREARNEVGHQNQVWKSEATSAPDVAVEETQAPVPDVAATEEPAPAVMTESRLQLTAPDEETIQGAATAGDPQTGDTESGNSDIEQQLAMAAETAEANRAQSEELSSRVTELEEQLATMKRLLELKDDQLASMQNQQLAAAAEATELLAEADEAAGTDEVEASTQESVEPVTATDSKETPAYGGLVNKLMDNPILAGLGVLVAMLLGGFIWASTRRKDNQGMFDEMTLEKRLESEKTGREDNLRPAVAVSEAFEAPVHGSSIPDSDEGDPLTEADVYLAYGRIQQAEDVLQAALEKTPDDAAMRLKLLEVYHAGGNISAFDREASDFRDTVTEDDANWLRVATMGYELSPDNELYKAGAGQSNNLDFDMDLSGMDDISDQFSEEEPAAADDLGLNMEAPESPAEEAPEILEYNLDEFETTDIIFDETEEDPEGLLDASDEVSTKLDLARAYLDMGDPDGARSILDEVLEEGSDAQKDEAGKLIAEIA